MWAVLGLFPSKREGDGSLFCALTRLIFVLIKDKQRRVGWSIVYYCKQQNIWGTYGAIIWYFNIVFVLLVIIYPVITSLYIFAWIFFEAGSCFNFISSEFTIALLCLNGHLSQFIPGNILRWSMGTQYLSIWEGYFIEH